MSSQLASTEMLLERYEQSMRMNATRSSALSSFLAPMNALSDIVDGVETVLNENPILRDINLNDIEKKPISDDINIVNEENTCAEDEVEETLLPKLNYGLEEETELFEKTFINLASEDKAKDFKDCWGCELRAEFDWEVKPVNFLAELDDLFNDIEDIIDHVLDSLSPYDLMADLCPLFDLDGDFNWMCGADLLALLQGIQLVLSRYLATALNITLNWTAILGPLIKFIADTLTMCMENIRNIILAPIDCINAVLKTASKIQDEFQELAGTVATTAGALKNPFGSGYSAEGDWDPEVGWNGLPEVNEKNTKGDNFKNYFGGSPNERAGFTNQDLAESSDDENWKGIPTGFSFNYNSTLDSTMKKNKNKADQGLVKLAGERVFPGKEWAPDALLPVINKEGGWREDVDKLLRTDSKGENISLLKKMILTLNSAEDIINNLFANLIFTIKSLNKIVVGNISLNLKLGGIILFLIDLINLVGVWIEIHKSGGIHGFKDLCNSLDDEKSDTYNAIFHPWIKRGLMEGDRTMSINKIDQNNSECGNTED